MLVSVALCTYNGADYLAAQLQSIADQTVLPDEIVVVDDGSHDGTADVVNQFADSALVRVCLDRNDTNLGVTANFQKAIQACRGEIVFLCDQDDVWDSRKIETMSACFDADPTLSLVFSNARLVDASLRPLGRTLWEAIRFTREERSQLQTEFAFNLLLRRYLVTGATMAFQRGHVDALLPFSKHMLHDAWISLVLSSIGRIGIIDQPLIDYRQHPNQQVGERDKMRSLWTQFQTAKKMDADYFSNQLLAFTDVRDRIQTLSERWVHPEIGELAERKVRHCAQRVAIRESRPWSLPRLASESISGRYGRFSYGWKSVAQDLFL